MTDKFQYSLKFQILTDVLVTCLPDSMQGHRPVWAPGCKNRPTPFPGRMS